MQHDVRLACYMGHPNLMYLQGRRPRVARTYELLGDFLTRSERISRHLVPINLVRTFGKKVT